MIGTKRRNVSLRSDAEDSAFQSKRISGDSLFSSQGLESSQQQVAVAPSLDLQRAGSSQQHVRALNTQFASWVQSQLQNHPDELWEDGVRDYLTHASNILEKFGDVVSWLKANTENGGIPPSLKAPVEKKHNKETTTNEETARLEKPMFGATNKFAPSWNSSVLPNSQTSAQNKSPLFPWTSGVTTQSQSPSSGANATLETSLNSQTAGQSTTPLFPPWTPGVFSKSSSPSSGTNSSGGASSNSQVSAQGVFSKSPSPSSGTNASGGASSNSQVSAQGTSSNITPWTSGVLSKNQSPPSGTNASGGASSNSQVSAEGTSPFIAPWTSGVFSKNQSPSSGTTTSAPSSGTTTSAPSSGTTTSAPAAASWSFGSSPNNQTPFSFGGQSTTPLSVGTTNDDADEENEERPSSPSVKKSEEKGIVLVHEVKCKLYLKSSDPADKDPWKDKGTGQLSIKCKEGEPKGTKESKPTILVRNDVGRILLNAFLYTGIKTTSVKSNSIMAIFHTAADGGSNGNNSDIVARTFLIKTKNEEERNKLAEAIRENAPAA